MFLVLRGVKKAEIIFFKTQMATFFHLVAVPLYTGFNAVLCLLHVLIEESVIKCYIVSYEGFCNNRCFTLKIPAVFSIDF